MDSLNPTALPRLKRSMIVMVLLEIIITFPVNSAELPNLNREVSRNSRDSPRLIDNAESDSRLLRRSKRYIEWGPDVAGPYCATRRGGCCPNRIDSCAVPILDTLCYCDEFCDRERSDCCPDFRSFCRGTRPTTPSNIIAPCEYKDRYYRQNDTIQENCNLCRCAPDSRSKSGYSFKCENDVCLIRENVINIVNNHPEKYWWRASNYSQFWGLSLAEGRRYRLGTHKPDDLVLTMTPIKIQPNGRLLQSFDARIKWGRFVHGIRDQGNCASSWAFSTTAMAADRLSIESKGVAAQNLSPQNLLSCNRHGQDGCRGGSLDRAWWYIRQRGLTTEDCYPYVSGSTGTEGRCQVREGQTIGPCLRGDRVFQSTPPYRIAMKEYDIMTEIEQNGPVQATFKVQADFFMYQSGVYRYSRVGPEPRDERNLYHSVRIIGWGEERVGRRVLKYWRCANSWGTDWGEDGYFRIARGENECEIESFVVGAWGKVAGDDELQALLLSSRRERYERFEANRRNRRHLRRRRKRHHKAKN
ncbi:uncharacterized peptidase C1-like protein F26E4.3 [Mya arenaria]|uniref:uncharacterized peptidase C1-like protein F26E4.3 n=1 Tax=Mya arenaria TaxID=6604 RepID=UPI0022E891F8|nr:uncharacterized peptidase C1-like protein F26E4.3 [Mya arenaria]